MTDPEELQELQELSHTTDQLIRTAMEFKQRLEDRIERLIAEHGLFEKEIKLFANK